MPRVSPEHRHARQEQILAAAERRFARDGFHATSMQDIFVESGLSAGAVYRYFPSKTALVRAIVGRVLDGVLTDFRAAADEDPPRPLAEVIPETFGQRVTAEAFAPVRSLVLQVWAEMSRDEEIRAMGEEILVTVHATVTRLVERAQRAGEIHPDTDPAAAAQVLTATAQGHIVQLVILGEAILANFPNAMRTVIAGLKHRPLVPAEGAWLGGPVTPGGPGGPGAVGGAEEQGGPGGRTAPR